MSSSHNHNNHGHQPRHLEFEPNHGRSHDQHGESQYGHRSGDALADQQYDSEGSRRSARIQGVRNWASGNTGALVGAAAVLAGAAAIALTRNKWGAWGNSLSDLASRGSDLLSNVTKSQGGQSEGQSSGQASAQTSNQTSGQASQTGKSASASKSSASSAKRAGSSSADASLNQEVASKGIKPSPTSGKSFTDEGATGNND